MIPKFICCRNCLATIVYPSERPQPCLKLGHTKMKNSLIWSPFHFCGPKDTFEMKIHQKLSNFLAISREDLSMISSLFSRFVIPDYQTQNLGLSRPPKAGT